MVPLFLHLTCFAQALAADQGYPSDLTEALWQLITCATGKLISPVGGTGRASGLSGGSWRRSCIWTAPARLADRSPQNKEANLWKPRLPTIEAADFYHHEVFDVHRRPLARPIQTPGHGRTPAV